VLPRQASDLAGLNMEGELNSRDSLHGVRALETEDYTCTKI